VVLEAPDNAVNVPANAEVDQVGKLADKGDARLGVGLVDRCVNEYTGVSDGERMKR